MFHEPATACLIFDGGGVPAQGTGALHAVFNNAGNAEFVCHGTVTPPSSGGAATWNYGNTGLVIAVGPCSFTTQWSDTVTPSGDATMTIHDSGCL